MDNQYSIEQILNGKINQKAQQRIGQLSVQLFEAEAKVDLLEELYNNLQREMEELRGKGTETE